MVKGLDEDLNRFYDESKNQTKIDYSKNGLVHAGSCYESHPALKIPGTELVIYGGSCLHPAVKDAEVYVGFDHGMRFTPNSYPWHSRTEFLFEIKDMSAPSDIVEFRNLINWTSTQLTLGKKVHCGCIGGHGRTGTFFAALVCEMTGEKDAISYVRENYCRKAVETGSQIKFLVNHFGIRPVDGSKVPVFVDSKKKKTKTKPDVPLYSEEVLERASPIADYSVWD